MSRPADDFYSAKPNLNLNETDVIPMVFDLTQNHKLLWKLHKGERKANYYKSYVCKHNDIELKVAANGTLYLDKYKFCDAKHIYDIINEAVELSEATRARKLINQFFTGLV